MNWKRIGFVETARIGWQPAAEYDHPLPPRYFSHVIEPLVDRGADITLVDLKDAHEAFAELESHDALVAAGRAFVLWANDLWERRGLAVDSPMLIQIEEATDADFGALAVGG